MTKRARQQGELESLILNVLWNSKKPLTSQEILERVGDGDLALLAALGAFLDADFDLCGQRIGKLLLDALHKG